MTPAEEFGEELPLLHLLPLTHRLFSLADSKKQYGLTKSQTLILVALFYRGTVCMSQIAAYLNSSKEQATRAVAGMVELGLIERYERPDNRTHVYVRLTDTGRDYVVRCCTELSRQVDEKLDAALTAEERSELKESLRTVIRLLDKI